jgi:hypothetical protein
MRCRLLCFEMGGVEAPDDWLLSRLLLTMFGLVPPAALHYVLTDFVFLFVCTCLMLSSA